MMLSATGWQGFDTIDGSCQANGNIPIGTSFLRVCIDTNFCEETGSEGLIKENLKFWGLHVPSSPVASFRPFFSSRLRFNS